jgi:hypothetical protein
MLAEVVLEDVQDGGHVLADAGLQQVQDQTVGAQLGDLAHEELIDVGRQLGGVGGKRPGDLGGALDNGRACSVHGRIVRPTGADSTPRRTVVRCKGRPWATRGSQVVGGCAPGTSPRGFFVTGAQWQAGAAAVPSGNTKRRPAPRSHRHPQGGPMDFSSQLDDLQQRAANAKTSAQAAVTGSREQLRQRIDQAKVDVDLAAKDARQDASAAADTARSKWA